MNQQELLPDVQCTLPAISGNFEALESSIKAITEQYTGLLVQEADVPAIKNEMAGLNKLAGRLADARKDVVARISGPIRDFEDKVKSLEAMIKDTRTFLDEQVKAHVQRERDGRRASVKFIIDHQKHEFGCPDIDIPIQESWLNKTAKDKDITLAVRGIILAHKIQQEEKAALEQAKKDRVIALENHCKAMEQARNYALSFSRFAHLQGLDMPLADALAKIGEIYAAEDARIVAKSAPPAPKPAPHFLDMHGDEAKAAAPVESQPVTKAMTISATYSTKHSSTVQKLYQSFKALCLTCSVQIREI
jgi:hypothetical protein